MYGFEEYYKLMAISMENNIILMSDGTNNLNMFYQDFKLELSPDGSKQQKDNMKFIKSVQCLTKVYNLKCNEDLVLVGGSNDSFQTYKMQFRKLDGKTVCYDLNFMYSEGKPRYLLGGNFISDGCYTGTDKFGRVFMSNYKNKTQLIKADDYGNVKKIPNIENGNIINNTFCMKINDIALKILEIVEEPIRKYSIGREKIVEIPQNLKVGFFCLLIIQTKLVICGINGYLGVIEKKTDNFIDDDQFLRALLPQFSNFLMNLFAENKQMFKIDNDSCICADSIENFQTVLDYETRKDLFSKFMTKFKIQPYDYSQIEAILRNLIVPESRWDA